MRYMTDEDYSNHVITSIDRILNHGVVQTALHENQQEEYALHRLFSIGLWHQQPSAQVFADYDLVLNPLPAELNLAYAGDLQADFSATVNTFSLWLAAVDTAPR